MGTFPAGQHPAMSVLGLSLQMMALAKMYSRCVDSEDADSVHAPIAVLAKN